MTGANDRGQATGDTFAYLLYLALGFVAIVLLSYVGVL